MRVTKAQFQENREKILEAASRLFRERGFEQVGVVDVMKAAGLTHGGFYGHFESKDDLIAQAACRSSPQVLERWTRIAEQEGPGALRAFADIYLSDAHRGAMGDGCMVAALGPEIARQPAETRARATGSLKALVDLMQSVAPGETEEEKRKAALAAYAGWIGAMVLARISDDPAFAREALEAVR